MLHFQVQRHQKVLTKKWKHDEKPYLFDVVMANSLFAAFSGSAPSESAGQEAGPCHTCLLHWWTGKGEASCTYPLCVFILKDLVYIQTNLFSTCWGRGGGGRRCLPPKVTFLINIFCHFSTAMAMWTLFKNSGRTSPECSPESLAKLQSVSPSCLELCFVAGNTADW